MSIRVIIVDDEPLAREGLALYLNKEADVEVVAECENGIQAVKKITELKPDLVYLDIEMPGLNGFEVIKEISPLKMPLTIFVTAYNEYAIQAFDVNALDYLLKPIDQERFSNSIKRVRDELRKNSLSNQGKEMQALLEGYFNDAGVKESDENSPERIVVKSPGQVYFIKPKDVAWIEANGDYVNIYAQGKKHLIRETMKSMEERLSAHEFQRIHRSCLVCLNEINKLVTNNNGDYDVILNDGTSLKLSRHYRDELYSKLQNS